MGQLLLPHLASQYAVAGHPHGQAAPALAIVLAPLMASAAIWIWQLFDFIRHSDNRGNDGNDGGGGGGGGRGGGEPHPPAPGPDSQPEWWPEFEREFAGYVKSREPQTVRQTAQAV